MTATTVENSTSTPTTTFDSLGIWRNQGGPAASAREARSSPHAADVQRQAAAAAPEPAPAPSPRPAATARPVPVRQLGGYFIGAVENNSSECAIYSPLDYSLETIPPIFPSHANLRSDQAVLFIGDETDAPLSAGSDLHLYASFAQVPVIGMVHPAASASSENDSDLVIVLAYLIADRAYTRRPLTIAAHGQGAECLRLALKTARALLFGRYRAQLPRSVGDVEERGEAALTRAVAALDTITVLTLGAPTGTDWIGGTRNIHLVNRSDALADKHYGRSREGAAQPVVFHFEDPPAFDEAGHVASFDAKSFDHAHRLQTYLTHGLGALAAARRVEDPHNLQAKVQPARRTAHPIGSRPVAA